MLNGKTVLITGSSKGIGREIAYKFAKEGCNLIITYYADKKDGEITKTECLKLGSSNVLLLHLNIMDTESIKNVIQEAIKQFGKISILVNNAGVSHWDFFKDQSLEDIETELRTNLEGLIKITRVAIEHITDTIINTSSLLGIEVEEKETVYCASKWGVRGFTKALALEYPNLKIYSINPRGTATQMNDFLGDPPADVAEILLKVVKGELNLKSGADINIWEYLK